MSQIDEEKEFIQESEADSAGGERGKLVPVSESIRYRKRAQSAERQAEELSRALNDEKTRAGKLSAELESMKSEQKLVRKLSAAGAVDVEAVVLLAKARLADSEDSDLDECIEGLRREKAYLFGHSAVEREKGGLRKTAGARERTSGGHSVLERAANRAATTGNRSDLQEYLRLRRNSV